jgi:asparagine synthase (glutamine-hydrolysing)
LRIGPDFFSNFASYADRTVYNTDGCFGVLGAHEIYLNEQARLLAPVRLTGNFGSEVFRGMSTFQPIGLSRRLVNPEFHWSVNDSARHVTGCDEHPVTFAAFKEIPWNLFGSLAASRSQVTFRTPYLDNEIVALAYQAPEVLRRSALPALRLIKANSTVLSNIPTDRGYVGSASGFSVALRRAFAEVTFKLDYVLNEGCPNWLSPLEPLFKSFGSPLGILGRHKYLHYRRWFGRELVEYVTGRLNAVQARQSQLWNPVFLEAMGREHAQGRKNYLLEINAVLTLEAVERLLFRDLPRGLDSVRGRGPQSVPEVAY